MDLPNWSFDMDAAPRGTVKKVDKTNPKGVPYVAEVFEPDLIIAASSCGVVTISRWIPDQERWNMFSKNDPPIAWMPCEPPKKSQ